MSPIADFELRSHINARSLERGDLLHKSSWVDDHAIANNSLNSGTQDPARDQLEDELLILDENGVARVVPALVTGNGLEFLGQQVNDFPFAFVTPLRSEDDQVTHDFWWKPKLPDCNSEVSSCLRIIDLTIETMTWTSLACGNLGRMQLCGVFLALGPDLFRQLVRGVSIGKLKTYQVYERFKLRARLAKLNSEALRKAEPKFWARIEAGEEDFATDLSQVLLLSHLDMIADVLTFLGIPNDQGFFDKDLKPDQYLTEGWQKRVFEQFSNKYPREILLFYINHLDWELNKTDQVFLPAA